MNPLVTVCASLAALVAWADSPESVLATHDLKPVNGLWQVAADAGITSRVQAAERLERRIADLGKQIERALDGNELMKVQQNALSAAHEKLREARDAAKDGSAERKRLDEQIKQQAAAIEQLKKAIVPADKLGAAMPLKGAVMELVGARSELAFHVLAARRRIADASAQHERLQNDPDVAAALAALDPPGQLAPLKTYAAEMRSLNRIEKLIFTSELPLYREGRRWRVTGIANEELPLSFSLYERDEATVITRSMAESLGLKVSGRRSEDKQLADGPNVKVTPMKLASLRFGRHVLKDVDVLVLPADYENIGARISLSAFRGLRARVFPERLLLHLQPKEERSGG